MGALREGVAGEPCDPMDVEVRDGGLVGEAARAHLLGRLSAGLVHEARNPLNAMSLHLELLAEKLRCDATGEVPPQLARNLDCARKQVRRLDELLRQWGEFTCGRSSAEELATSLARAAALAEYQLRRSGLVAELEAAPGQEVPRADRLCQLVAELLLAAADVIPGGTTLVLAGRAGPETIVLPWRSTVIPAAWNGAGSI